MANPCARGKVFTCATGRECPFVVFETMGGRSIPVTAVKQLLASGSSELLEGCSDRSGRRFDAVLSWTGQRVQLLQRDPRQLAGPVGPCPRCAGQLVFERAKWRCTGCDFRLPGKVAQRDLSAAEVCDLLGRGRTARLHGFRHKNGSVFKAALELNERGHVQLDYSRRPGDDAEPPLPPGAPPPAFGRRMSCPACVQRAEREPGYVVAGRAAWGCSHWRQGCELRVPFQVEGVRLDDEQAARLFGRHKATRYAKGFVGPEGPRRRSRVVLDPSATPCWRIEEQKPRRRRR